ncbi:GNAT family N-acetyltransferase [Alkalihalobacillus hwajinpoensis]|uniref:GNAT family N-acetyltransferase n=1 Tax=Guptibacillus hwajinpoensis TaxID=208199 RepID=UPI001883A188|nr:GNAT family protein [Pseudalkalibacillus hwajinpoensis]MBF0707411.1 GNAT family N-acetyltransferase [Pseudalkalibacillus hwajinpoensis]
MFTYQINDDLYLRMYTIDDAEALYHLIDESRDYLKEWLAWVDYNTDIEASREFIQSTLKGVSETGGYPKTLGMFYKGELAGTVGFNEVNRTHKYATIGYWLSEKFQKKGIVTEACRGMINLGFNEIGLNRIEIRAASGNKKSQAVPERLGFTKEAVVREAELVNGQFYDHIVYGMLAREWLTKEKEA